MNLVDGIQTLRLSFDIAGLVVVVIVALADEKLLLELLLGVLLTTSTGSAARWHRTSLRHSLSLVATCIGRFLLHVLAHIYNFIIEKLKVDL